jgi:hypothetical protein
MLTSDTELVNEPFWRAGRAASNKGSRVDFDFRPTEPSQEADFNSRRTANDPTEELQTVKRRRIYASNKPKGTIRDASE